MEKTEEIKTGFEDGESIGLQYRSLEIREDAINDEDRSVNLSFSSEEPGERLRGFEILDHEKGAARMERINTGAPLLWNHDPNDQIGVVDKATIGDDKRGHAVVRFGKSQRAQEIFNDVKDRIKTLVSFGYRIHQVTDTRSDDEGENSYRVTDWEPFEISLVSIPMDMTVGVGRASGDSTNVVRVASAETSTPTQTKNKEDNMSDINKSEASETETRNVAEVAPQVFTPSTEDKARVRREEIKRQNGIRSLGEKFGFEEKADQAVEEGTDLESFRRSVTETWEAPSASINHDGLNEAIGMNAKERREFSVVKAIRDIKGGGLEGLEREVSEQAARNAGLGLGGNEFYIPGEVHTRADGTVGTDSEGGYTVATEVGGLIDKLDAQLVSANLGATRLTGLQGNVNLPKLTGGATASWVGEDSSVTAVAQVYGQLALSPNRLSVRTVYSDQLVNQSSLSVENIVRDDLIKREALALDLAAMDGTGSNSQPTGVANTSGIGSITFGGAATFVDYVNIWDEIAKDNAVLENLAYVTSSTSIAKGLQIAKVASSDSQMIINEAPGGGFSVLGIPVVMFNQALTVANQLLIGNWSELIIASWGPARKITVDPYSKAATGQVAVTTNAFHDIGVRHAESFAKSSDSAAQ